MAATSLIPVEFHGTTLSTTIIDGIPYVAIKPICEAIGVDWQAQHARIKRHPVLNSVISVTKTTGADGKQYDMLMLPLDKLNGWLFGISVRRVKPELQTRITQYQAECFDVLARHFGVAQPGRAALPIAQKPTESQVASAMGLGHAIAGHVQHTVVMAVLRGGDDWKHKRYLLSFVTDSKLATPPIVQELSADTHLLSQDKLTNLMAEAAVNAWHTVLGDIRAPDLKGV